MDTVIEDVKDPEKAKRDIFQYIHDEVFRLNFYRLHMLYFLIVIAISSVIVYGEGLANASNEIDGNKLRYIDALFLTTSAMTTTELNTVNLGDLTGFQQAVLAVLLSIGNVVFVSTFIVIIRVYYFRKKLADLVEHSKAGQKALEGIERDEEVAAAARSVSGESTVRNTSTERTSAVRRRQNVPMSNDKTQDEERQPLIMHHHHRGFGSFPAPWESQNIRDFFHYPFRSWAKSHQHQHTYLSFEPSVDLRGRIHSMNEHERTELGGVEYRALKALIYVLIFYQVFWLALGIVFLVPYSYRASMREIISSPSSQPGDLSPGWWASFAAITSFSNGGLNVLDSNFEPFQSYYFVLIVAGALTVAGQTQFPIFLRLVCWTLTKILSKHSRTRSTFLFLLHHPRRCFIYLFPAKETWVLFAIQLVIDFTAWVLFEILNIGVPSIESIPPNVRVFDGLFQAVGLRTSGAYITNISNLAPALLVAYVVAMYISSFPIVMALRRTNTYEERSIGLDKGDGDDDDAGNGGGGGSLAAHLRIQLAYDLWFQMLAWFIIAIVERSALLAPQPGFGLFPLLFEVTSAYGTVGLSMSAPRDDFSLSGRFKTLSKVVMLFVMVRGRHRGLPFAIDRSILLPGEELMHRMDREYNERGGFSQEEEREVRREEEESGEGWQEGGRGISAQDPEKAEEKDKKKDNG